MTDQRQKKLSLLAAFKSVAPIYQSHLHSRTHLLQRISTHTKTALFWYSILSKFICDDQANLHEYQEEHSTLMLHGVTICNAFCSLRKVQSVRWQKRFKMWINLCRCFLEKKMNLKKKRNVLDVFFYHNSPFSTRNLMKQTMLFEFFCFHFNVQILFFFCLIF